MDEDLAKLLKYEKASEKPCSIPVGMPYPCTKTCPCALRDRVISDANEIERLRVLVHAAYREGFSDRDDARMTGEYAADVHDAWGKSVVRSSLGTKDARK